MTSFRLRRPGAVDLEFDGVLLADESTKEHDGQTHWTEVRIYRTTSGKYVTETIGRTTVTGQVDRITVTVHDQAADVRNGLRRKGVSAETHQPAEFIPNVALDALDIAAAADPALEAARVEKL